MGSVTALKFDKVSRKAAIRLAAKKVAQSVNEGTRKATEKVIDLYIRPTSPAPFLTEQEKEETVIKNRLKARKLARSILRKWHARLDLQEVDSIVDLSLCEAVRRFNPTMGASFMTFLFYHLRGNLIRAVSAAASTNLVGFHDFELSAGSGDPEANGSGVVNAIEVAEALVGNDYPQPDEIFFKREMVKLSQEACTKLDALEQEVINRIYLQGQQIMDIANSLGYSRCHISRVKKKALEALYEDLALLLGVDPGARPNFDDDERSAGAPVERRKIHRRRPRSKKACLAKEQQRRAAAR